MTEIALNILDISENYLLLQAAGLYAQNLTDLIYLITWIMLLVISFIVMAGKNTQEIVHEGRYSRGRTIFLALIFVWSFVSLSQVSTFIYFQF